MFIFFKTKCVRQLKIKLTLLETNSLPNSDLLHFRVVYQFLSTCIKENKSTLSPWSWVMANWGTVCYKPNISVRKKITKQVATVVCNWQQYLFLYADDINNNNLWSNYTDILLFAPQNALLSKKSFIIKQQGLLTLKITNTAFIR